MKRTVKKDGKTLEYTLICSVNRKNILLQALPQKAVRVHHPALFITTGLFNVFCTVTLHLAMRMLDLGVRMLLIPQEAFLPQQVASLHGCL